MNDFSSLKGKSVFVTGHTGFKGSWLCLWLSRLGANVTGYSLEAPTEPHNFGVSGVLDVLEDHYCADIRDAETLTAAMARAAPDLVLHLAAQTVVREGYRIPRETFDVNVMGTIDVLESVRQLGRPCAVICVTSDKCYENKEQVWGYREADPMGERDPYGASKGAAELAIRSYRYAFFPPQRIEEHGVKLASARAGNVIGGGDWTHDALMVDVVKALRQGEPVCLRNPSAVRPWQHVLQALSGYLALAVRLLGSPDPRFAEGWNFGPVPGDDVPVREIVELFHNKWGGGSWRDVSASETLNEAGTLRVSIDKAIGQLGWKPHWDVHTSVEKTVDWYRHYVDHPGCMRDYSLHQIREFEQQAAGGLKLAS
ncbi:MAG: CDP-glucose 4,6-dehydratase [Pseudomonadota bacterium]